MKIVKSRLVLGIFICFFTLELSARETEAFECEEINSFISYKDARALEKQANITKALQHYCNLAYLGDYRAQYKFAEYYSSGVPGVLEKDLIKALFWASISNSVIVSNKKSKLISKIKSEISKEDLSIAEKLLYERRAYIISGIKYDMQYKDIDYEKINKKLNEKKVYTGSRIKRKEPFGRTDIAR